MSNPNPNASSSSTFGMETGSGIGKVDAQKSTDAPQRQVQESITREQFQAFSNKMIEANKVCKPAAEQRARMTPGIQAFMNKLYALHPGVDFSRRVNLTTNSIGTVTGQAKNEIKQDRAVQTEHLYIYDTPQNGEEITVALSSSQVSEMKSDAGSVEPFNPDSLVTEPTVLQSASGRSGSRTGQQFGEDDENELEVQDVAAKQVGSKKLSDDVDYDYDNLFTLVRRSRRPRRKKQKEHKRLVGGSSSEMRDAINVVLDSASETDVSSDVNRRATFLLARRRTQYLAKKELI